MIAWQTWTDCEAIRISSDQFCKCATSYWPLLVSWQIWQARSGAEQFHRRIQDVLHLAEQAPWHHLGTADIFRAPISKWRVPQIPQVPLSLFLLTKNKTMHNNAFNLGTLGLDAKCWESRSVVSASYPDLLMDSQAFRNWTKWCSGLVNAHSFIWGLGI